MSESDFPSVQSDLQIAISGATGLVGASLTRALNQLGTTAVGITRSRSTQQSRDIQWDPQTGLLNPERLSGVHTVVHLAGEGIANRRWSAKQKARIKDSRVTGTLNLVKSMSLASQPPSTLICASAIGYYGDRGEELLTEESGPGTGFLPDVGIAWEKAADEAALHGIRVVKVRIGVVMSHRGGALKKMMTPFRLGVGGILGSGRQYMSWISLNDLARVLMFCIDRRDLSGVVNAVSPEPITNHRFTKALGNVLNRPTILPVPAFALRLSLGQMADDLLLASARVVPEKLTRMGFQFQATGIESCLKNELFAARQGASSGTLPGT